jgi:uncharacterized membrane protein YdjX (TVP38/TMEM64 family)
VAGDRTPAQAASLQAARLGPRLLLIKALLLGVLALAGALLARIPGVREWLAPAGRLIPILDQLGWTAAPLFTLGSALLITLGVPRLVFCPLAGAAFGFGYGLLLSTIATMISYIAVFFFVRGRIQDDDTPFTPPPQLAFLRQNPGLPGVIVARLIPLPGLLTSIALSLSPVRRRTYLFGSLVGLVPEAVPLVLLGAGLLDGNPKQLASLGAGALLLILISYFVIRRLVRKYDPQQPLPD